jgi:transcriptional regulator with XRE-family HTH domain
MTQHGSYGEQLRKAREARQLSLKEVEDEIKIREDFLREFENGNWDFPLPDVYKRGFLRVYAEFLGLDVKKLLTFFPTAPNFSKETPTASSSGSETLQTPPNEKIWTAIGQRFFKKCKDWRWQVGGLVLLVAFLLFFFLHSPSSTDGEWADLLRAEESEMASVSPEAVKKLTLIASDNVQVLVRTKDTKRKIFSAFLKKGAAEVIDYAETLQISFSEGSALGVRTDSGEMLHPKKSGVGWMEVSH